MRPSSAEVRRKPNRCRAQRISEAYLARVGCSCRYRSCAAVHTHGTFWPRGRTLGPVQLYHLPGGLFVELCHTVEESLLTQLRAFTDATALQNYASSITLPAGFTDGQAL